MMACTLHVPIDTRSTSPLAKSTVHILSEVLTKPIVPVPADVVAVRVGLDEPNVYESTYDPSSIVTVRGAAVMVNVAVEDVASV